MDLDTTIFALIAMLSAIVGVVFGFAIGVAFF